MEKVLLNKDVSRKLREKGSLNLQRFSWSKSADELMAIAGGL
jgi:hypothetical protein